MTFDEKVKILRTLPLFKVTPIAEIRAIAFAAKEQQSINQNDLLITKLIDGSVLVLTPEDVGKIVREYPDLEAKLD